MYSTRAFHVFSRFPTRAVAVILLPAVLVFMALGCGGGEPAPPGGDVTPQSTAESRPREREPGSGSAGANTPLPTARAASSSGAATPDPTSAGQSGPTPGQTGQPAPTAASGGQSGTTPSHAEDPPATMVPTATPAPPPCASPQPASDVMRPPAQTSPETDREALVALFNATDGESWDSSGTWLSRTPIGEWLGVTTNVQGRVTGLRLVVAVGSHGNLDVGLTGELPPELGNLTMLQSLWLSGDWDYSSSKSTGQLSGEIPPELGNLANLQSLTLSFHQFSGEIPPELGNLDNLQRLTLRSNQLTGEIPPELSNLANLQYLALGGNQLCGEIPPELGNLASLNRLDLDENRLSGEIPPELGNLASLQQLNLRRNQLNGELPPELGGLSNLHRLYLNENQLSGDIPPELENLFPQLYRESGDAEYWWQERLWTNLWWVGQAGIDLGQNQFSGCISDYVADFYGGWNSGLPVCTPPDHPGDTETLVALAEIWDGVTADRPGFENWLSRAPIAEWEGVSVDASGRVVALTAQEGRSVPELGNLANLRVLVLGWAWEIPPELGNLANLQVLALFAESIQGEIPPELGNLTNLELLALISNRYDDFGLSGEIPPELGNLANLRFLHLVGNSGLGGEIPPELVNLTSLQELNLYDTNLSGCVPASLRDQGVKNLGDVQFCP